MKFSVTKMIILGILLVFACGVFGATAGVTLFLLTANSPQSTTSHKIGVSEKTSSPDLSPSNKVNPTPTEYVDSQMAYRIKNAFIKMTSSSESHHAWIVRMLIEGSELSVFTVDPKKEIWVIGIEYQAVSAGGKSNQITEIAYYDISTSELTYSQMVLETIYSAGKPLPEKEIMPLD